MEHGIAFARQQSIHADARFSGHLFEASAFQFMADKYRALFFRQLVEREFKFVEEYAASVKSVGSGIGRRQQVF